MEIQATRKKLNFKSVRLNVRSSNHRAIACYRRCGFRVRSRAEKTTDGGGVLPYLVMEFNLSLAR